MKTSQIAAQLYTCRDLLKTPEQIAQTLRRVREAGYRAVQVSGMGPIPEEELMVILDGEGLECCATHEPAKMILEETSKVIERLGKLRCHMTAYPFPAGIDFSDEKAVDKLIAALDKAGAEMATAGMTLCYHNHHQEFRKIGGRTILDRLYASTSPRHLQAEPDVYWIQYGGGDPVDFCANLAGRLPLIHLKDYRINTNNHPEFCELGEGNLSFARIVEAAEKSGCQWFIVEQDTCDGDPVEALAHSFRYLADHICAKD
jgi:sugar phosphate isomerase/epimerase